MVITRPIIKAVRPMSGSDL